MAHASPAGETHAGATYRDPQRVADELGAIREGFVYFADDNMFFDRRRMAALHGAIVERGIRKEYFLFSRADAVVKCRELVERWAEIGLRQVFLLPTRLPQRDFFRQMARWYWRTYSPLRAIRVKPNTPPPTSPRELVRNVRLGLRTYWRIRNAYRDTSTPGPAAEDPGAVAAGRRYLPIQ